MKKKRLRNTDATDTSKPSYDSPEFAKYMRDLRRTRELLHEALTPAGFRIDHVSNPKALWPNVDPVTLAIIAAQLPQEPSQEDKIPLAGAVRTVRKAYALMVAAHRLSLRIYTSLDFAKTSSIRSLFDDDAKTFGSSTKRRSGRDWEKVREQMFSRLSEQFKISLANWPMACPPDVGELLNGVLLKFSECANELGYSHAKDFARALRREIRSGNLPNTESDLNRWQTTGITMSELHAIRDLFQVFRSETSRDNRLGKTKKTSIPRQTAN